MVSHLSTYERVTTPRTYSYVSQHFCDNQTDKQTGRIKTCVFSILDHILNTAAECRGLWWRCVGENGLPAYSQESQIVLGYVSLLLLGFSKDRFPLSSAEEFNQRIWKSHDVTVSLYFPCEKPSGRGGRGGRFFFFKYIVLKLLK